jgi:ribosomal protein S5
MLKATFDAFMQSESPKSVAAKRSKKVTDIIKNNKQS